MRSFYASTGLEFQPCSGDEASDAGRQALERIAGAKEDLTHVNSVAVAELGDDAGDDLIVTTIPTPGEPEGGVYTIVDPVRAPVVTRIADADSLSGGVGDDVVYGGAGDDRISGGSGNDRISSRAGMNTISGGAGRDVIRAANGASDEIDCGRGRDQVTADRVDVLKGCESRRIR